MDAHHLQGGGPFRQFAPWGTIYSLRHLGSLRNLWFGACTKVLGKKLTFSSAIFPNIYLELGHPSPLNHALNCLRSCQVGKQLTASINKCQLPIISTQPFSHFISSVGQNCAYLETAIQMLSQAFSWFSTIWPQPALATQFSTSPFQLKANSTTAIA